MSYLRKRIEALESRHPRVALNRVESERRKAFDRLLDVLRGAFPGDQLVECVQHRTCTQLNPVPGAKTHEAKLKELVHRIQQDALTERDRATLALMETDAAMMGMTAVQFAIMNAESFDKF